MARNKLLIAPPYPVEQALKELGANLRVARVRRKLTIDDVAEKVGTGRRAIRDAEKGKPSTGIAVYAALLWVYGLLTPFEEIASPDQDTEGLAYESKKGKSRARKGKELENDF